LTRKLGSSGARRNLNLSNALRQGQFTSFFTSLSAELNCLTMELSLGDCVLFRRRKCSPVPVLAAFFCSAVGHKKLSEALFHIRSFSFQVPTSKPNFSEFLAFTTKEAYALFQRGFDFKAPTISAFFNVYIRKDTLYSNAKSTSRFRPTVRFSSHEFRGIAQGQGEIIRVVLLEVKLFSLNKLSFFLVTR
jgi:hypothetical protein